MDDDDWVDLPPVVDSPPVFLQPSFAKDAYFLTVSTSQFDSFHSNETDSRNDIAERCPADSISNKEAIIPPNVMPQKYTNLSAKLLGQSGNIDLAAYSQSVFYKSVKWSPDGLCILSVNEVKMITYISSITLIILSVYCIYLFCSLFFGHS